MNKVFIDTWAWYALSDLAFVVMRSLELTQVFTGDHHFATMGFVLIPQSR